VGRRKQPEISDRILDACVNYALVHGLPARLAPLAAAAGVSQRMLIYHFGSRDALLRETLTRARERQLLFFGDILAPRPDEDYRRTLGRAWHVMTGTEGRRYLNLFGRLREDAGQELWPDFRRDATVDWLPIIEEGLRTLRRPDDATLVLAVIRGLIMDLEATEDRARIDQAFARFVRTLSPA